MKTAIVIPARYASSRLPAKPLLRQTGKYLLQHVYDKACQARCADRVIIATDDPRIVAAAKTFDAPVVMTRRDHASGTDRVAEVAHGLSEDIVINLQGDEPEIDPKSLDLLAAMLTRDPSAPMATLATPVPTIDQWKSPNCVKVVCDDRGRALYFSRSPVPFVRDGEPDLKARPARFLQHLGLYAYRRSFLLNLTQLPVHALEEAEKLEQLRALAAGQAIQVGVVAHATRGVDTLEDYNEFVQNFRRAQAAGEASAPVAA